MISREKAGMIHPVKYFRFLLPVVVAIILVGCHKDEEVKLAPAVLVNFTKTQQYAVGELRSFLGLSGFNVSTSSLQYNVSLYTVTYNTTFKGQKVIGSGLVALPNTSNAVGMISFQHGTIAAHAEAPSVQSATSLDVILYSTLASPGFIAVVPDFLGLGSSASMLHPYYVKDATSTAVMDLLKASKELATLKAVDFNGKLFLAGYSEGGYATMATHRAIEKNGLDGFTLVASFPASGGYDVKGMQEYFFGLTTYGDPFYLAYVAMAYQNYYEWGEPLSKFFQQPYAANIPGLFDGSKNGGEINALLTDTIARLVNTDLLQNIDSDNQYQYIVTAFTENSLLDWKPTIKMFMYHGDADTTVPFQNSVDTYNQLIANGASADILTLTLFPGKTHATGVNPYIEDIIPKILSMN